MEMSMRAITGAAETADSSLVRKSESLRTWAGHGTGAICNGCGQPVQAHEIEYEVEMPAGSDVPALNFHLMCYRNWSGRKNR